MSLSRRDFVKLCTGTVAGYGVSTMFNPVVHQALAETLSGERPPVFWIQGASCTGCSVSLLNYAHPSIAEILLKIITLEYHQTLMAGEGTSSTKYMLELAQKFKGKYFVVVEGGISTAEDGKYCIVGESEEGEKYSIGKLLELVGTDALAILAVGTCAAYGGIPAAKGSITECVSVSEHLNNQDITTPVINIPGCPAHPNWIVGTIALALETIKEKGPEAGLEAVVSMLDEDGRPLPYYGESTHITCEYLPYFDLGIMSTTITDKSGCRYDLGCKGPVAKCNSPLEMWNGKVNWCIENSVCIGCVEPDFPDGKSPFYLFE